MKPMRVAEMGPPKGMSEMERAADAPMIARCCGVVLLVGGESGDDDLEIGAHPLGEEGTEGAVGQPHGQDGFLGGPSLAAEEAPRDTAHRVQPLLEIDGEGEEVDPLPGRSGDGGHQQYRVALADRHRAVRLAGQLSSFQNERAACYLSFNSMDMRNIPS